MGDVATRWCQDLYPANESGDEWGRIKQYRESSKYTSNSFSFSWFAIGLAN